MHTLVIQFPQPTPTITIQQVPEDCVTIKAMVRHKKTTLLLSSSGKVYCTRFGGTHEGIAYCSWDSDYALDFLPALFRLGLLPKGYSITQARKNIAARDKRHAHSHAVADLQRLCRRLNVKVPKVKPFSQ